MTEETPSLRGEAAWKQEREAIAKRNADAHRRGQAENTSRDRAAGDRDRMEAARESVRLQELNAELAKRRTGASG